MASFKDIGAIQRREAGDGAPVAATSYEDIGAIAREEAPAAGGGDPSGSLIDGKLIRGGLLTCGVLVK